MTDAQRIELNDASYEYRVRAQGIQAKKDIVLKIWRSSQEKGLRIMARLVGDTPTHLAYLAGLGVTKKALKSGNCIRETLKPENITGQDALDLISDDQQRRGKRDQSSFRYGGREHNKVSGHGQRRSAVNLGWRR